MYVCFACHCGLSTLEEYFNHLKVTHKHDKFFEYPCEQNQCPQNFSSIHTLKRHLKIVHSLPTNQYCNVSTQSQPNQNSACKESIFSSNESETFFHPLDTPCSSKSILNPQSIETEDSETAKLFNIFFSNSLKFVLKLVNEDSLPRKKAFEIIDDIQKHLLDPIKSLFDNVESHIATDIIKKFCLYGFSEINSEYKLIKHLETADLMKLPKNIVLSSEIQSKMKNGIPTLNYTEIKGTILSIPLLIRKFFEQPQTLDDTLEYMTKLGTLDGIQNFVSGSIWKQISKNFTQQNKIAIPYFLYNDDFDPDNILGSHSGANSISAFYLNFPTIPPHRYTKLKNILPAMLIKSSYMKKYEHKDILHNLFQILLDLEMSGLTIKTEHSEKRVYFVLGMITGDNLGLNTILGFTKSFSATYFCRICTCSKVEAQKTSYEIADKLRTKDTYQSHLLVKDPQKTGIIEPCIFNELPSFHVTVNTSVDIMHDLFEGVIKNDMCLIILYFIENKKYFSLVDLNDRKELFDYGEIDSKNISPRIKLDSLTTRNLKMSASETWCFIHFFGLMIGDLIPKGDRVWSFFLNLQRLVDICLKSNFNDFDIQELESVIAKHHKEYCAIFAQHLKPKAHFLTHYPTIIKRAGPLKLLWSMRNEGKHKELKKYASSISSRVNLCYSLSVKVSFKMAYLFCDDEPSDDLEIVRSIQTNIMTKSYYSKLQAFGVFENRKFSVATNMVYKGTYYKANYFILKRLGENKIYKIIEILIYESQAYVVAEMFKIEFSAHFNACILKQNLQQISIHKIEEFEFYPCLPHTITKGATAFRFKII